MKFYPGDPVWLRAVGADKSNEVLLPDGEHAAVVEKYCEACTMENLLIAFEPMYHVAVMPTNYRVSATEGCLRPRRDDYQQHEGLLLVPAGRRALRN